MATLITAQQRIRAAARAAGWQQAVTDTDDHDTFFSATDPRSTLRVVYNDRRGIISAWLTTDHVTNPVGGGQQRMQRIVDLLHSDVPSLHGSHTWAGAR